ncbi:DUF4376 domain-containing protein [Rhodoplanes serenus]|uniref:DUF4376 domain-containing protein n=1 Tax=Rhodoplanes serenus TaxID=200615 RepID=A0A9X4XQ91_9BRAD|nr:DUF4376 domain-containing protein [Rhodoplanes serenus]MTW19347.1 DUF4376 domain-containing protein [Rhodoplanes serenus]
MMSDAMDLTGLVTASYADADHTVIDLDFGAVDRAVRGVRALPGIGWYDALVGGQVEIAPYVAPPVDLVAYAADARWRRETGGITIDGLHIATDDRSKLLIAGARIQAEADPAWSTVWTAADGARHPVSAAQVIAISAAVLAHVDAGFRLYDEVLASIAAGSITTPAEIDAVFAAI